MVMNPRRSLIPLLVIVCLLMTDFAPRFADAAAKKKTQGVDEAAERMHPIRMQSINGGRLAESNIDRGNGEETVALWVSDDTKQVRGVILSMHRASEAYRTDLHALARAMDYAVYGTLIRWDDDEIRLPLHLARLGEELEHPEVASVPWVGWGVSRNVKAQLDVARKWHAAGQPDRYLCFIFAGGPGPGLKLDKEDDLALFRDIPILTVNGSKDPFVHEMEWQTKIYPKIREKRLPYTVAVDWGEGHALTQGLVLAAPFIDAARTRRVPEGWSPNQGLPELKPFTYDAGYLVGSGQWEGEVDSRRKPIGFYKGDLDQAVWVPDANTAAVWIALHKKNPAADPPRVHDARDLITTYLQPKPDATSLSIVDFGNTTPFTPDSEHADAVDDRGNPQPTGDPTSDISKGFGYYIAWGDSDITPMREGRFPPRFIAQGEVIDIEAGHDAGRAADAPARVIQLPDTTRGTLDALTLTDIDAVATQPGPPPTAAAPPTAPTPAALDALAVALVEKLSDRYLQQSNAAAKLIQEHSSSLAPSLRRMIDEGRIEDDAVRARVEGWIESATATDV